MFKNKNILITGGSGMIGRSLLNILIQKNANITVVDLTKPSDLPEGVKFTQVDLRYFDQCEKICEGMDYVFNLVGIKGSPKMCAELIKKTFQIALLAFDFPELFFS